LQPISFERLVARASNPRFLLWPRLTTGRYVGRGYSDIDQQQATGIQLSCLVVYWVSRDQFAQLVERVYLDFDFNYHTWLENMDKAFASWKQANQPV
jgi:hypothetical protein